MSNVDKARKSRIGLEGYCRILRSIAVRPGTEYALAERFGLYQRTLSWMLSSMHKAGLVHRREWVRSTTRMVPIWAWGRGGDVSHPHERSSNRKASQSVITITAIRDALEHGPMPMDQLAVDVGFCITHMRRSVLIMRRSGIARISEWDITQNNHVPMYSFGIGRDAQKPQAIGRTPDRRRHYLQTYSSKLQHIEMLKATAGSVAMNSDREAA